MPFLKSLFCCAYFYVMFVGLGRHGHNLVALEHDSGDWEPGFHFSRSWLLGQ